MKIKDQFKMAIWLLVAGLALSSCSADISGGGSNGRPTPNETNFQDKVGGGPNVDGSWVSGCVLDPWSFSGGYAKYHLTIQGRQITHQTNRFSDYKCLTSKSEDVSKGMFRFVNQYADNIFEIQYWFESGSFRGDNIRVDEKGLWVNDRHWGEGVVPDILLKNDSTQPAPPPAPKPTPAPAPTPAPPTLTPIADHKPNYGQFVRYEGKNNGSVQTEEYTNQGVDDKGVWTVFRDVQYNGRTDMGYKYYTSLWSTEKFRAQMKTCLSEGGVIETITVKAGTFETCKEVIGNYRYWIGNIPIWGNVKIESLNGKFQSELVSFEL